MKITTEEVSPGINYFVIESDYLNIVAQGKTLDEALNGFDNTVAGAFHLAKTRGFQDNIFKK